jgi:uncharacterized protein (TIGR02996 family)
MTITNCSLCADFLAAIKADMDNDATRLIFADHIDEDHGQAERGEFIRLQCRIETPWTTAESPTGECWQCYCGRHGHQHTNGPCHCTQEWKATLRREQELKRRLPILGALWAMQSRFGGDGGCRRTWCRGFIESVTCSAEDWLTHADAILAEYPVREVTLTDLFDYYLDGRHIVLMFGTNGRGRRLCKVATTNTIRKIGAVGRLLLTEDIPDILSVEFPGIKFNLPSTFPDHMFAL